MMTWCCSRRSRPRCGPKATTWPGSAVLAWDALKVGNRVEVLVTRIRFPPGQPHGVALARHARAHRPAVRVLFAALPEFQVHTEGLGAFLAVPVSPADIAMAVARLLAIADPPDGPDLP